MDPVDDDGVLREAYGRFGRTGPQFEGWLSNHGPMVVEAMVRHGHRKALGKPHRLGDWPLLFAEQIERASWRTVLGYWAARWQPVPSVPLTGRLGPANGLRGVPGLPPDAAVPFLRELVTAAVTDYGERAHGEPVMPVHKATAPDADTYADQQS